MDPRQKELHHWLLKTANLPQFEMEAIPNDASFRRYFRIKSPDATFVAMDAPPGKENCKPYIFISKALRQIGLQTPAIFLEDVEQGFLLITDFGSKVLLNELTSQNVEVFYQSALDSLALLQTCRRVDGWNIPFFTADFIRNELALFKEWFLEKYLYLELSPPLDRKLNDVFVFLAISAAQQTQVFMHRDYHSANLMVLPSKEIGILDFQDAFIGPVTYDLVSLLRDCYIDWPDEQVMQWVLSYREKINLRNVSDAEFLRWFDLMGLQRHLKALLTFSRKFKRDQNPQYLKHIPRTLNYITRVSARYPECEVLYRFMSEQVVSACME